MAEEKARWDHGLDIVDQVYGPGSREMMAGMDAIPFVAETVNHVFGDIWAMPNLSMRDKRLLVLGATAMLGRSDLVEIQMGGALTNNEFTPEQLAEIPLLLLFYCGAGNTTAVHRGIEVAKAKHKAKTEAK